MLLSLRLFPASPNWLLNLSLPHLGVGLANFFLSVLIGKEQSLLLLILLTLGLTPYNFLCVQTGLILNYSTSVDNVMDYNTFAILTISSVVVLAVAIGMRKLKQS